MIRRPPRSTLFPYPPLSRPPPPPPDVPPQDAVRDRAPGDEAPRLDRHVGPDRGVVDRHALLDVDGGNDRAARARPRRSTRPAVLQQMRSEEHTSELQSQSNLVCRLLLEKKNHA